MGEEGREAYGVEGVSETRIIHVRDWDRSDPNAVYIGRSVPRRGIPASPWANPFPITEEMSRELSIKWFGEWSNGSPEYSAKWIREHVQELRGKTLVCWCAPNDCHGRILAEMAEATQ